VTPTQTLEGAKLRDGGWANYRSSLTPFDSISLLTVVALYLTKRIAAGSRSRGKEPFSELYFHFVESRTSFSEPRTSEESPFSTLTPPRSQLVVQIPSRRPFTASGTRTCGQHRAYYACRRLKTMLRLPPPTGTQHCWSSSSRCF